jgi:hypothetical protein
MHKTDKQLLLISVGETEGNRLLGESDRGRNAVNMERGET